MSKKPFFISLFATLLIACILIFVGSGMKLFPSGKDFKDFLDTSHGDVRNILVVGVDKDGIRSDVNMLVSVNAKEKTVNILSIPRDTRVRLGNGYAKINACLGKEDGDILLIETVRELTGLPVHSFCKINFEGVRNVIDLLGGVEYNVPIDMDYDDPAQDLHIHLKKGLQVLDGADAEGLLRFRSGYKNADLGRINTQQDFLKELVRQKLKLKYVLKIIPVMGEMKNNLETDLSTGELISYAWKFRNGDNITLKSHTLPGSPKTIGGVSYYICNESATETLVQTEFGFSGGDWVDPEKIITTSDGTPISEKVID